jgi:hypothetical protein
LTTPQKEAHKSIEPNSEDGPREAKKARWGIGRWLLSLLLLAVLAIAAIVAVWLYKAQRLTERIKTHVASQPHPGFAIGDLGGMPVMIPRYMAEMLEYDGDPGWSSAPDWRPPVRTFDSKMNSFGFHVRFPDGATLDSHDRREEKRLVPPWEDRWISVGVSSSKHYPGSGFLKSYEQSLLKDRNHESALFRYHPRPEREYGLESYKLASPPEGPDPSKTLVYDQFFARDDKDELIARIYCAAVRVDINRSMCTQVWSFEDHGLKIKLSAQYRRPMLQHWREIQPMVTRIVLGFRNIPAQSGTEPQTPMR